MSIACCHLCSPAWRGTVWEVYAIGLLPVMLPTRDLRQEAAFGECARYH